MPGRGEQVAIARLGRPHGLRGAITAHADGPTIGTLGEGDVVIVRQTGTDREMILSERTGGAPRAIVAFRGITTREDVARFTGGSVMVDVERLPPVDDPDTFYVRDILGFEVRDGDTVVGSVSDVRSGRSNDVLVVQGETGEILLPFTRDAVVVVDTATRSLVLRKGLL